MIEILTKSKEFAEYHHNGTNHKYDGKPYTYHLSMVVEVAERFIHLIPVNKRDAVLAACWCHDTIEDCRVTYNDVKSELGQDGEYEGSHVVLFDGDKQLKIWFSPTKGFTIQVKEASVNISNDNLITIKTDNKVVVDSPNIELGAEANPALLEAVVKGEAFVTLFNSHIHPTAGAPPAVQLVGALKDSVLSGNTKTK